MSQISLAGNVYSDDGTNRSLTDGGHRDYFFPLLEDLKADYGTALATVSSTSLTCAVGSKSLTMLNSAQFGPGSFITLASAANPTSCWMHGQVTQRSGTSLWATMGYAFGSGTKTDWQVQLSGPINPTSGGTVRSVAIVSSSSALVVSGSPITGAGTIALSLTGDLEAIEALSAVGVVERLGTSSWGVFSLSTAGRSVVTNSSTPAMRSALGIAAIDVQVFSTSGTWNKPLDGVNLIIIEAVGGGGGGGGAGATGTNYGGGGGGGGYMRRIMLATDVTSSVAVTIGAGGSVGSSAGGNGGVGGNTTFGSYMTAYGGAGGIGANSNANGSGGGGGGGLSAGSGTTGGEPRGAAAATAGAGWGGAGGGSSSGTRTGGNAGYGGAGGSAGNTGTQAAPGNSIYGGGGGAAGSTSVQSGGTSQAAGRGGNGGSAPEAGSQPGGGGGGARGTSVAGGLGGAGLIRVICL